MSDWLRFNQGHLAATIGDVRLALERFLELPPSEPPATAGTKDSASYAPALTRLCAAFDLTAFERDVLLLCAGIDLDPLIPGLCAAANGDPSRPYPTFRLALAALSEPHWSAIAPNHPLRYWRMIEVGDGVSLTTGALRIDERILHFLTGVHHIDTRLTGLLAQNDARGEQTDSAAEIAAQIADVWRHTDDGAALPVVHLYGGSREQRRSVAATAAELLGLTSYTVYAPDIPSSASELEAFSRLWEREVALSRASLLVETEHSDFAGCPGAKRLLQLAPGAVLLSSDVRIQAGLPSSVAFELPLPTVLEQRALWATILHERLPDAATLNGGLDGIVRTVSSHFMLSPREMRAAAALASRTAPEQPEDLERFERSLWDSCVFQLRPQLEQYAQRIRPIAGWDDLVLPPSQLSLLREIALHVRHRALVYDEWGFGETLPHGSGISALFAGASGTGKTMAAEVLARELRFDLFRIDLSAVVSKFIGDTEKNLSAIFSAAERGSAILLFDEADALFGKRSEIKDSHDRYANIEVSYLLQRMETYRGLAILTTNLKHAVDPAFLRRMRFVVQFPMPDAAQRAQMWERVFPQDTPLGSVSVEKLSRLAVAGGNIRNIALNAAFLAADSGGRIEMSHLLRAARSECAKIEKTVSESEIAGWV